MRETEAAGPDLEEWLAALRRRFADVAARRVVPDAVEDVVQDALRVVVERAAAGAAERPSLAWCFQVLRNVIGDHYRRARHARARHAPLEEGALVAPGAADPVEALASAEVVALVHEALAAMAVHDGSCARYLRQLGAGVRPAELARAEQVDEAALYRRIYRCRQKLRTLLGERGIDA